MRDKPHRIRVRTLDGKPRDQKALNRLKSNQLGMPHLDIVRTNVPTEFIICAAKETHIEQARARLSAAGLEEVPGGDTTLVASAVQEQRRALPRQENVRHRPGSPQRGVSQHQQRQPQQFGSNAPDLSKRPYGFVALPDDFTTSAPVWHDGTCTSGRLSGEIRCELETLTPLLVGWERGQIDDTDEPWPVPNAAATGDDLDAFVQRAARQAHPDANDRRKQQAVEEARREYVNRVRAQVVDVPIRDVGRTIASKSVLCPLRAPWGKRPVIIPGDSLKGLLRHELGALLGAPMERVAERSYSYRPNAMYPNKPNPYLIPRLARVPPDHDAIQMKPLYPEKDEPQVRVPVWLQLLPEGLKYDRQGDLSSNYYRFGDINGARYLGGQGAGTKLNSKRKLHDKLAANPDAPIETAPVPQKAQDGYVATLRHLLDLDHGHFSERHPDVPKVVTGEDARQRILEAAKHEVFQPGDMIWVEWDTEKKCIVSFGWHYYYRWAYTDTVRKRGGRIERHGLFPLPVERAHDKDGAPTRLSAVRRLFGYTGDNEGSAGIGRGDYEQLMGRISVNAALEIVEDEETDDQRFLPPTFLKELGLPRPSAVEHYLKQPYYPNPRPSDQAKLVTYGDAAGYDEPGELAGRKFYLDRKDAYTGEPWKDDSEANRLNDRSTLALEASRPRRRFRFTVRFRDLDPSEVAAVLVALCPNQFREVLNGSHPDGYCSKLGYARPLGWGSVRIEAKALLLLDVTSDQPMLRAETDIHSWVRQNYHPTPTQEEWLAVHRHKHPDAADYPKARDRRANLNIYTFHTKLRAEHSRLRRYRQEES